MSAAAAKGSKRPPALRPEVAVEKAAGESFAAATSLPSPASAYSAHSKEDRMRLYERYSNLFKLSLEELDMIGQEAQAHISDSFQAVDGILSAALARRRKLFGVEAGSADSSASASFGVAAFRPTKPGAARVALLGKSLAKSTLRTSEGDRLRRLQRMKERSAGIVGSMRTGASPLDFMLAAEGAATADTSSSALRTALEGSATAAMRRALRRGKASDAPKTKKELQEDVKKAISKDLRALDRGVAAHFGNAALQKRIAEFRKDPFMQRLVASGRNRVGRARLLATQLRHGKNILQRNKDAISGMTAAARRRAAKKQAAERQRRIDAALARVVAKEEERQRVSSRALQQLQMRALSPQERAYRRMAYGLEVEDAARSRSPPRGRSCSPRPRSPRVDELAASVDSSGRRVPHRPGSAPPPRSAVRSRAGKPKARPGRKLFVKV